MKSSTSIRYTFPLAALAAILAGCSMGASQMPPPDAGLSNAMTPRVGFVPPRRLTRSWISTQWRNELRNPHHRKQKLLYVTDLEYASVDVVNYRTGAVIGQVAGLSYPEGDCSDKNGNVYVADFSLEKGFEIQAGTTNVINSWNLGGEAIGCSVSNSGDVAFSDFYPGGVWVFPGGGSSGTFYSGPGYLWPAGYDNKGNLFAWCDYVAPCSNPRLAELPAGSSSWILLTFSSSIPFPAGIEWDGKYLAMGLGCTTGIEACIDQVTVSGSTATIVNTVQLSGGSGCSGYVTLGPSWAEDAKKPNGEIKSHTTAVAAANLWCFPTPILVWRYPAGGDPQREISVYPYELGGGVTLIEI